jgi:hypothetical protein
VFVCLFVCFGGWAERWGVRVSLSVHKLCDFALTPHIIHHTSHAILIQGLRSVKYAAKYGVGFKVPNPIVRKNKEVRCLWCLGLLLDWLLHAWSSLPDKPLIQQYAPTGVDRRADEAVLHHAPAQGRWRRACEWQSSHAEGIACQYQSQMI